MTKKKSGTYKPPSDRVVIFDTTLRDGEQAPGAGMTIPEKIQIAHKLAELGVDVIGMPAVGGHRGEHGRV